MEDDRPIDLGETTPARPRWQEVAVRDVLLSEEFARAGCGLSLILIFALTIAGAFWILFHLEATQAAVGEQLWQHTKDLLEVLLPAETALLGAAIAFYFATKK